MLRGFADELVKLANVSESEVSGALRDAKADVAFTPKNDTAARKLRGQGAPVSRDYLASMLIGAAAAPALAIAGKGISRAMHNRAARKSLKGAIDPEKIKRLKGEIQHGPMIGRARPDLALNHRPALSHGDLLSDAAKGALGGSVVQMIRDQLSGSGGKKKES